MILEVTFSRQKEMTTSNVELSTFLLQSSVVTIMPWKHFQKNIAYDLYYY